MPVLTYLDLLGLRVIESHQNLARTSNTSPHVSNSPLQTTLCTTKDTHAQTRPHV
jgi:hypothetical protein